MSDDTPVSPAQRTAILAMIATSAATKKDTFHGVEAITIDGGRFHKEYPELFPDKTASMGSYRTMIASVLDTLAPDHTLNLPGVPTAVEINGAARDIAALQTNAKFELCTIQFNDPAYQSNVPAELNCTAPTVAQQGQAASAFQR